MKNTLFPLAEAVHVSEMVRLNLAPDCERIEVAGSVRRKKAYVHDVDLVVWPKIRQPIHQDNLFGFSAYEHRTAPLETFEVPHFIRRMHKMGWLSEANVKSYDGHWLGIVSFQYGYIPVEIYITLPDGSNFEALWQMRTGPAEFNLRLIEMCKYCGCQYKAGYGIFRNGERVDDGTERRIFDLLKLRYLEPSQR